MNLDGLFKDAEQILLSSSPLHRDALPRSKELRKEFIINLCVVALGIRAGFLIDTFSPPGGARALQHLLAHLQQALPTFDGVKIVFTFQEGQYFFINAALCRENVSSASAQPTCVQVMDDEQILLVDLPAVVKDAVIKLSSTDQLAIALPVNLIPQHLVCLAGIILEYRVAYLPSDATALTDVHLHVYECIIKHQRGSENAHEAPYKATLVRFSIPEAVAGVPSLSPRTILDELRQTFGPRIERLAPLWELHIMHEVVIQDKVVF